MLKRFWLPALSIMVLLLAAFPMSADIVLTTSNQAAFWNAVAPTAVGSNAGAGITTTPNQGGLAYWDHQSFDANSPTSKCNIGWIVTGAMSGCSSVEGAPFDDPSAKTYWSAQNNSGNFDPNFWFNNDASGPINQPVGSPADSTELEMRITGFAPNDIFGWYESDVNGAVGTQHALFTGGSTTDTFGATIGTPFFGFYLTNGNGATFYTESASNTADRNIQHFAVLRVDPNTDNNGAPLRTTGDRYYIGVEDLQASAAGGTDFDYNDLVVEINQVPEPASILLFGTLVAGCSMIIRRRRRSC